MIRAVNLGPTPTATQEQENTADIIDFERVKALRPGSTITTRSYTPI